jgi:hypothetical protein
MLRVERSRARDVVDSVQGGKIGEGEACLATDSPRARRRPEEKWGVISSVKVTLFYSKMVDDIRNDAA